MRPLLGACVTIGQPDFKDSATPLQRLGTLAIDEEGNRYRYVKAGGTALVVGNALQGPVWPTDQTQLAPAANAAIGDTTVTVTNGATNAITANQYALGSLIVETTPGEGYTYRILSNSAAATGATITLVIASPGLRVAITAAASKVSLHLNKYNGVMQAPITTLTGPPVGAAIYPITAEYYGWIGTGGTHATLIKGTPAVFNAVSMPSGAAGAVAINSTTLAVVGFMRVTGVDGAILPVEWQLD